MSGAPAIALHGVEKRYPGFTLGPIDLDLHIISIRVLDETP
jgi:hypothetical protein